MSTRQELTRLKAKREQLVKSVDRHNRYGMAGAATAAAYQAKVLEGQIQTLEAALGAQK